jgi:hypothetical protein
VSDHLSAYLNDHLGGAVVAIEMLEHLENAHAERVNVAVLGRIRSEIEEDRRTLEGLMSRLGVTHSRTRRAAGWLAERGSRLKLAMDDPKDGAFRVFETIELISLGIDGKIALWTSLAAIASSDPNLSSVKYDELIARARAQRAAMEPLHSDAARAALEDQHVA